MEKSNNGACQNDEANVRSVYQKLLESWNDNNSDNYAAMFTDDASVIRFDGSQMNGRKEIHYQISKIFANHKVSSYVSIVKEFRMLSAEVFLIRGVAGMIPPGKSEINPAVNAIQSLIAKKQGEDYRIVLFQNTPAAFHGRPELSKQLTEVLQEVFDKQK